MLPSEDAFAAAVSALGIQNKDDLVVCDGKDNLVQLFGDGGLPRWRASGYDIESSASVMLFLKPVLQVRQ
ncbi:Rhodanese-like domain superfamily [Sesbania bispinosa]|nr:Rhodanese-like domain superfamily [Sesbania bispinosa]